MQKSTRVKNRLTVPFFIVICSQISVLAFPLNFVNRNMEASTSSSLAAKKRGARVAFVGNSIQYFNDMPRFLTRLSRQAHSQTVVNDEPYGAFIGTQDSCFRGGVNLVELWREGNGMLKYGFASEAALIGCNSDGSNTYDVGAPTVKDLLTRQDWDFVVLNDHTQGPARKDTRDATVDVLTKEYARILSKSRAVPIIIETASYRLEGINNSHDLGTTEEFQLKVREGVQSYLDAMSWAAPTSSLPRIAPVGTAYLHVRENSFQLWEQLFDSFDNFHPSPKGTFLQSCVIFYTMFSCPPPLPLTVKEMADLWKDARMMNSANRTKGYEVMPLPTVEEANYLCSVAEYICERKPASSSKSNL